MRINGKMFLKKIHYGFSIVSFLVFLVRGKSNMLT